MGLTRSQYRDKQRDEAIEEAEDWRKTPGAVVRVRGCLCRSVWCPRCAKISPTNAVIRDRLEVMDWRKVRHCILTVSRESAPSVRFEEVRKNRAIAKTMALLSVGRWIWILEFHRGGWPHWHVLIENGGRMVGHGRLQAAWGRGLVWESPINSENHWRAIMGYHKSKGYLAGEAKGHQLELPEYLRGESRVRKFGASFTVSCPWPRQEQAEGRGTRRKAAGYKERFKYCDTETTLLVGGRALTVAGTLKDTRATVEAVALEDAGGGRYLVSQEMLPKVLAGSKVTR